MNIDQRFNEYHKTNPRIYELFKHYAYKALMSGRRHYGAKAIMEIVRWETSVIGNDEFKVNNSYVSRYVRLLIAEDELFEGFFRLRELKSQNT